MSAVESQLSIPAARAAATAATRGPVERLLFLVAAVAVVLATLFAARLVLSTRTGTIDSYYYFARAADLNDGASLAETRINWGEGVDRKFFPGYPLLLHWLSFGSPPERAWRTVAVLLILIDPILMGFALRRLGLSYGASCAAVAFFATSFVPLNWMTMPMAEGAALLWLCLSAIALPAREERTAARFVRFLAACFLGGMAILCRAEAAFPAAAIGLVGVSRIRGSKGWLACAAGGVILGILPFAHWVASLPPATTGNSRLHYVNEFFKNFVLRDSGDGIRGGVLDNFLRSWVHPIINWGRIPLVTMNPTYEWMRGELDVGGVPILRLLFMGMFLLAMALGIAGFGGGRARRFALAYFGFVVFRSFWYYSYDRFLVTGLPMGFAAAALVGEDLARHRRSIAILVGVAFVVWAGRGMENCLRFGLFYRLNENFTHSYRDEREFPRLQFQTQLTTYPLEGADVAVLEARRLSKKMATEAMGGAAPWGKRNEKVALELPWAQVAYGLRPRPVILGYPLENFWGPAAYRRFEYVPEGPDSKPIRTPRRAAEFLREEGVKYVISPLGLTPEDAQAIGPFGTFGSWLESKGFNGEEATHVREVDTLRERADVIRTDNIIRYEWPPIVHVYELNFGPSPPR